MEYPNMTRLIASEIDQPTKRLPYLSDGGTETEIMYKYDFAPQFAMVLL